MINLYLCMNSKIFKLGVYYDSEFLTDNARNITLRYGHEQKLIDKINAI